MKLCCPPGLLQLAFLAYAVFAIPLTRAADVSQNYAHAESLVRERHWDEGIAALDPLLRADPRNLKALNLMGIALTGKGDLRAADDEFQRALRINPQFLPALKNLAVNEFTLNQVHESQQHFLKASRMAGNDPVINVYLGEIAYTQQDYQSTANYLPHAGKLLLQDPNVGAHLVVSYLEIDQQPKALEVLGRVGAPQLKPRTQFELGLALARHDLFNQAIFYFATLHQANPESYDVGFNLAVCDVQLKKYTDAISTLQGLAERGHKTSEMDNLLAEAYEGNQQTQAAIDALREATILAPQDENNYLDLAALCIDHDSFDLGLEVVNVGLRHHPQSERLIFQRGVLHAMQDKIDLAEQDFQLANNIAPEKNFPRVGLGVTYLQAGDLPRAIRVLRQGTQGKPNDFTLHYLLGEALVQSGVNLGEPGFQEAQLALEKSVSLNPNFAPSQVQLAKIYLRQNRTADATTHLETARRLDPKEKAVYSQLAIAYRREGKTELAHQMLTELQELNEQERANNKIRSRIVRMDSSQR